MEYVFIWFIFGVASSFIASSKGYDGCGYFFLGLLLGPIALLIVIFNQSKKNAQKEHVEKHRCGFCGFVDASSAAFCPACDLDKKGYNKDHYKRLANEKKHKTFPDKNVNFPKNETAKKENKKWLTIIIIIGVLVLAIIVKSINSREKNEEYHLPEKQIKNGEKYEWVKDDFKSKGIIKQYEILYDDLRRFKFDEDFHSNGFDEPLYGKWMQRVMEIENSKNKEFIERRGLNTGDLIALGKRFITTKGLEDSLTTSIGVRYDSVLRVLQQSNHANVGGSPNKSAPATALKEKQKNISKTSSYKNCKGVFDDNGIVVNSDNVTLMVTDQGSGIYQILFYVDESENFYFRYRYQKTIGSTHYYKCIDCGNNGTSIARTRTKLSDFTIGIGGTISISITEQYSEMKVTIITR